MTVDLLFATHKIRKRRTLSTAVTTRHAGELLLAFVAAQGPKGVAQTTAKPKAPGLVWKLVTRAVARGETASVWQARARGKLTRLPISMRLGHPSTQALFSVVAFNPGATLGAHGKASTKRGAPKLRLSAVANAQIWAVGHEGTTGRLPAPLYGAHLDQKVSSRKQHDASWVQSSSVTTGGPVAVGVRSPLAKNWILAAVTVVPATSTATSRAASRAARSVRSLLAPSISSADRTFAYNPEGDRTGVTTNGSTTNLGYDQANRLTSISGSISYSYDGDSLRMSKTVSGTTTQFAWDESGSLPLLLQDGNTYYIYGPNGQPIEQISGSTPTYLLADQQGSTRLLTDNSGNVAGTYSYDPWGNVTSHTGSASTNLQYDAQYVDSETGFEYVRARYYDPSTGQFLTVDPLSIATRTTYTYAADTPVNASDPSGLFCVLGYNPNGSCRGGSETITAVQYVHGTSTVIGTAAGACSIVGFTSVIGTPVAAVCDAVGTGAGWVGLGTGEALYATGHESAADLGWDVFGAIPFGGPIFKTMQWSAGVYGIYSTVSAWNDGPESANQLCS